MKFFDLEMGTEIARRYKDLQNKTCKKEHDASKWSDMTQRDCNVH